MDNLLVSSLRRERHPYLGESIKLEYPEMQLGPIRLWTNSAIRRMNYERDGLVIPCYLKNLCHSPVSQLYIHQKQLCWMESRKGNILRTRSSLSRVELSFSTTASRSAELLITSGNFGVPSAATRMVNWRICESQISHQLIIQMWNFPSHVSSGKRQFIIRII